MVLQNAEISDGRRLAAQARNYPKTGRRSTSRLFSELQNGRCLALEMASSSSAQKMITSATQTMSLLGLNLSAT